MIPSKIGSSVSMWKARRNGWYITRPFRTHSSAWHSFLHFQLFGGHWQRATESRYNSPTHSLCFTARSSLYGILSWSFRDKLPISWAVLKKGSRWPSPLWGSHSDRPQHNIIISFLRDHSHNEYTFFASEAIWKWRRYLCPLGEYLLLNDVYVNVHDNSSR